MLQTEFESLFFDSVKREERKMKRAGRTVIGSLKVDWKQIATIYDLANAWYTAHEKNSKADAAKWAAATLEDMNESALYAEYFNFGGDDANWEEHKTECFLEALKAKFDAWREELRKEIFVARLVLEGLEAAESWAETALQNERARESFNF